MAWTHLARRNYPVKLNKETSSESLRSLVAFIGQIYALRRISTLSFEPVIQADGRFRVSLHQGDRYPGVLLNQEARGYRFIRSDGELLRPESNL